MKKTILFLILILVSMALAGCQQQAETEGRLAADKVDIIPDISIDECLTQIKETNPEMSDQDANDNCYAIEAVNKQDKSLCDKIINGNIRSACLNQFE